MKAKKITAAEINNCKVASLPTHPTATQTYGGVGYSANDLKDAFDKLPLLLAERYNDLFDDIFADRDSSISSGIQTGLYSGHTLKDMFYEIINGDFAAYLNVGNNTSLAKSLYDIKEAIKKLGGEI